jgi:hypothetical protein
MWVKLILLLVVAFVLVQQFGERWVRLYRRRPAPTWANIGLGTRLGCRDRLLSRPPLW